jgi:C-terminal processing protease CtpA/Prc
MHKIFPWMLLVVGLFLLTVSPSTPDTNAKSLETQSDSAIGTLTSAEAQADFDLLRKALEEAHSGLYRYSTKAQMDRIFDEHRAKLNRTVNRREFLGVLNELIAQIKCGHTGTSTDETYQAVVSNASAFPLQVKLEGQRLIVLANQTPDDSTIRPGMEIVEINGRKPAEITSRILRTLSADGDAETGKLGAIQRRFWSLYWNFVDQASEFSIKAKDASGRTITTKLAGVKSADRAKNLNSVNSEATANLAKLEWSKDNLSMRVLKDPEIAQIKIRSFTGSDYRQWIENTFKTLSENKARVLILDLRGNGGGNDMYGAMLVSYLTDKPFRYFDHINVKTISPSFKEHTDWRVENETRLRDGMTPNPSGAGYLVSSKLHSGVAEQQPGKYPFMGQVFVLIDGGTFSTAADFCAVTHHLKRATFIGEETGGGYYGNNSGVQAMLTLPNSKLRVRLPMYEYWNAVPGYAGKRRGTLPDHKIETKALNLLRGVDEQLDFALKLANQKLSQAK